MPDHGTENHDQDLRDGGAEEHPTDDRRLRGVAREVPRVVVAVLGPAEPAERDRERQAHHEGLPSGAMGDRVQVSVAPDDPGQDREEDHEGQDQAAAGP